MENSTYASNLTTTTSFDPELVQYYFIEWIICDSLAAPLALICLYVTGTQLTYFVKKKYGSQAFHDGVSDSTGSFQSGRSSAKDDKCPTRIIAMSIFASFTGFLTIGIDFRLFFGRNDDFGCEFSKKYRSFVQGLNIVGIYLVLWMKQRTFYEDPRLKHLSSKFTRILSVFIAVLLAVAVLGTYVLFAVGVEYVGSPYGCLIRGVIAGVTTLRNVILIVGTIFFQLCFLGLFLYPLIKHQMNIRIAKPLNEQNRIIKLIKRSTILTAVCIVSDLLSAITVIFVDDRGSVKVLVYDIDIVINVISVILCFVDWRDRVMPWRLKAAGANRVVEIETVTL